MSSSLLEKTRNLHENFERYELLIENEMKTEPKTTKERVLQSHRVNHYLNSSIECSKSLINIYTDSDHSRKDELTSISGFGTDLYSSFYEKLREIKDYHRKFPNLKEERNNEPLIYTPSISFTGNEMNGKFLDLNENYEKYINLTFNRNKSINLDYLTYLTTYYKFQYNDINRMKYPQYKDYLESVYKYLIHFIERTQPLFELQSSITKSESEFIEKWNNNEFDPIENNNNDVNSNNNNNNQDDKLFCKACKKLFTSENVFNGHLKGKKHIQNEEKMNSNKDSNKDDNNNNNNNEKWYNKLKSRKDNSMLEYKINRLSEYLSDQIESTRENVLKKQSRSYTEVVDGVMVGGGGGGGGDDDEEDDEVNIDDLDVDTEVSKLKIANYPVDWSGKPIPYWVYRYLELGVEYKCEICGNQSYWGRKAYEKHFQETRHSYGMSSIGVPNTTHFHEITKIKDALELWSKIKNQTNQQQFKSDRDEEYEDESGNVMSKKNYDLLVKQEQGLNVLCAAYNITTDVNFDYCSIPNYIGCDPTNSSVIYLNLIGDSSNMTPFPNNTIGFFTTLHELNISNSILWNLFDGIESFLNKVKLNNTILYPSFPENTRSIYQFRLYDVQFSGNINSSLLLKYKVFELIYSDSSLMKDYLFLDNDDISLISCEKLIITVNNLFKFNYNQGCYDVTLILGKYFNDFNLTMAPQFKGSNLTITDVGHFNKPFVINEKQMLSTKFNYLHFRNIEFNFTDDGFLGFKKTQSFLIIENCSGLSNPIDIKFELNSFKHLVLKELNLTKLPEASFFENLDYIDFSNNKFSGPLPELIVPGKSNFSVKTMVFKGNSFSGSIPQSYCYHYIDLSNNQLSGELPMCYVCSLNGEMLRGRIDGNNFSNYQSGQTNNFPQCSGITFTSFAKGNSPTGDSVTGTNFGWNTENQVYNIYSTPDCSLFITIPNYELSTKLYYISIDQIKQANYKANVWFLIPNLNASLPIEIIPPKINFIVCNFLDGQYQVTCSIYGVGFLYYLLGGQVNLISVYLDDYYCNVTSVNSGSIDCKISIRLFEIKNYTVLILNTYSGLSSTYQYSYIPTHGISVSSIISPPRSGGIVTITGSFDISTANTTVMIGNSLCPIQFINSSYLTCLIGPGEGPLSINITHLISGYYLVENIFFYQDDPKQCLQLSECNKINGGGICNPVTGKCECSNYYQGSSCSIVSHFISSIIPSNTNGGNTTLFGWFGNKHFNAKVMIGNKECYPIYKINSTSLSCLAPPSDIGLYSINVTQNLIEYSLPNSYQYIPMKRNCPNDCTSNINGLCNHDSGYCYCFTNWYGFDCSIYVNKNNSITPPTNTTIDPETGTTNITNEYTQFQISILKLIELDLNNLQVNEYFLNDKWLFYNNSNNNNNNNNSNNNIFTFIQTIQNFTCNITYIIEQVKEKKNVTFAGIDYLLDKDSIKMTVSIENYSYKSSLNTLQLQMKSSTLEIPSPNKNDDDCNRGEVEIGNKNDQDNSLNFLTIKKDDKLLSGRFINKVESDGRPTIISTNVILKDKDSIIIGMNLPHCTTKCLIDPDFSLIISPDFKTECSESNKKPWLIPVAVVVPVVGISIIVVVYYFYKKQIVEKGFTKRLKMVELLNKKN
ncbi:hypothetical protein ACTFIZ_008223 [Dictyostelium cf. discoideum]